MKLVDLVDNSKTDKNTLHSYLNTYEELFSSRKEFNNNILEIGTHLDGSIKLWSDYFTNSNIFGVSKNKTQEWDNLIKNDKVQLINDNAYNIDFIKKNFIDKNIKFDIIIDDGPRNLESMIFFAKHYSELLSDKGILIIEDIQSPDWIPLICESFPTKCIDINKISIIDLRAKKFRYDDILIVYENN